MIDRGVVAFCAAIAVAGVVVGMSGAGAVRVCAFAVAGLGYVLMFVFARRLFHHLGGERARLTDIDGERGILLVLALEFWLGASATAATLTLVFVALGTGGENPDFWFAAMILGGACVYFAYRGNVPSGLGLTPTRIVVVGPDPKGVEWERVEDIKIVSVGRGGRTLRIYAKGMFFFGAPIGGYIGTDDWILKTARLYLRNEKRRAALGTQAELERIT